MLITFITFLQVFFLFLRHFYLFFPCQFLDSTLLWLCSHSLNYNKNIFVKNKTLIRFLQKLKALYSSRFQKYFVLLAVKYGIIKFDFNYILPLSKVSSLKSKFATSVIFLAILSAELSALSRKELLCPEPITPDILVTYFYFLCCYEDKVRQTLWSLVCLCAPCSWVTCHLLHWVITRYSHATLHVLLHV